MSDTNEKSMQKSTVQKKMVNESTASYGAAATKKRRSAISIMGSLIGLVKPLLHIMLAAIILGTAGYLCAIFLTILAGQVIVHGLIAGGEGSVKTIITLMLIIAVLRGILQSFYCIQTPGDHPSQSIRSTAEALSGEAGRSGQGKPNFYHYNRY